MRKTIMSRMCKTGLKLVPCVFVAALSCVTVIAQPRVVHAQGAQQTAGARALGKQGIEAFKAQDYEKALSLLTRAEEIHHATTHLLFMARSQKALGHPVEAYELYNKIIHEELGPKAPKVFIDAQDAARAESVEVEALLSYVTIQVVGSGAEKAQVTVDGRELPSALVGVETPVNPGTREFVAQGSDGGSVTVQAEMASAGHHVVELELNAVTGPATEAGRQHGTVEPVDSSENGRSKVPAYVAFGIGGAGVVVGTIFTIQHFGKKGAAKDLFEEYGCEVGCTTGQKREVDDEDKKAATAGTIGLIGYGVGAAGIAAGITLLLLSSGDDSGDSAAPLQPSFRPYVGFQQAGIIGTF